MRNIKVGQVKDSVLQIDFLYEEGAVGRFQAGRQTCGDGQHLGRQTPRVLNVKGFPNATITGVRIYNSSFRQVKNPDVVQGADVKLVNCRLEPAK